MKTTRLVFGLSSLVCALPIISVIIASLIASAAGCDLDEGSAHTCLILGADWSEALYAMFVLGWLGLMTLPLLVLIIPAWIITEVYHYLKRRKQP